MRIIYASDNCYFRYTYISIKTLLESNGFNRDLVISFIHQEVSQENLRLLKELGKNYKKNIDIIPFCPPIEYNDLPFYGNSKTTFAKFLFASMFPNDDLVLFLDPDTMVFGDLSPLFLGNPKYMFAGVIENLPPFHKESVGMQKVDNYINGGVVMCNLKKWREINFEKKVLNYMKTEVINRNFDQGIINDLCKKEIELLPPKYCVLSELFELKRKERIVKRYGFDFYYSQDEIDEAINNPVVVHFTNFLYGKPLNEKCTHPYTALFLEYLRKSPLSQTLEPEYMDRGKKIRRWVLHHFPFSIYCLLEKRLDKKRKKALIKDTKNANKKDTV